MTIAISSLTTPAWATMVDGQPLPAATLNSGINNGYTAIGNLNTVVAELENSFAGASAPTDKPAGKWWFNSSTLLQQYYEVANGQLRTVATLDGTQTLTNKTINTLVSPLTTSGGGTYALPDVAARTINVSGVDQNSYVSGTGTAGTDNTAQVVKTISLPANSLNALARGLRITVLTKATSGSGITANIYLGTAGTTGDLLIGNCQTSGTGLCSSPIDVLYASATTVHTVQNSTFGLGTVTTQLSGSTNIACGSGMTITVAQTQTAATHIIVYAIRVEVLG